MTTTRDDGDAPEGRRSPLTGRAVVLVLVVAALVVSSVVPMRAYFEQRAELTDLRRETAAQEARVAALEAQKLRWDDPAYVEAQARQRLHLVMPGEVGYVVLEPESICNPVGVDGQEIDDPTAHLECYRIKDAPGQSKLTPRLEETADPFGARSLVVSKPRRLCLPTEKDGAASELRLDDFKCYAAGKALPRFDRLDVHLADQFEAKGATVLRPESLCLPVDRDGEGIDRHGDKTDRHGQGGGECEH